MSGGAPARARRNEKQNISKNAEVTLKEILCGLGMEDTYRPIRSLFRADPGWFLADFDWVSAEMYVLANLSGDKVMLDALATSDLHSATAVMAFADTLIDDKVDENLVRKIRCGDLTSQQFDKLRKKNKQANMLRGLSKTLNFGIPYGRGSGAISRAVKRMGNNFSPAECQVWIDGFLNGYTDVAKWIQEQQDAVTSVGYVENPFGRRRSFVRTRNRGLLGAQQREAVNAPIQSTVGDAMSLSLNNFKHLRDQLKMRFKILLSIHDAVTLLVPPEEIHLMPQVAELAMGSMCPITTKYGTFTLPVGEMEVQTKWGVDATRDELLQAGVDQAFVHKLFAK